MKVKELITELLNANMDAEVELEVKTKYVGDYQTGDANYVDVLSPCRICISEKNKF